MRTAGEADVGPHFPTTSENGGNGGTTEDGDSGCESGVEEEDEYPSRGTPGTERR